MKRRYALALVRMSKSLALAIIFILAVSSLIMVESAFAQTIPKPSIPEFTVRMVESSLEITIKNQPITAFVNENSSNPSLYYGFRFKDHNATIPDWYDSPIWYFFGYSSYGTYYKASSSDYTVVSFPLGNYPLKYVLNSGRIDLQVMALIGNEVPSNAQNGTVYVFDGVMGVWSNTQTVAIPETSTSTSPSPNPTPTPTVPEFSWLMILPLFFSLLFVVVLIRKRKASEIITPLKAPIKGYILYKKYPYYLRYILIKL
jgi:hypothetical protein